MRLETNYFTAIQTKTLDQPRTYLFMISDVIANSFKIFHNLLMASSSCSVRWSQLTERNKNGHKLESDIDSMGIYSTTEDL